MSLDLGAASDGVAAGAGVGTAGTVAVGAVCGACPLGAGTSFGAGAGVEAGGTVPITPPVLDAGRIDSVPV